MKIKNKALNLVDSLFGSSFFICSNMLVSTLVIAINISIVGRNDEVSLYILSVFFPFSFIISAIHESLRTLVIIYSSSEKDSLVTHVLLNKLILIIITMALFIIMLLIIYYSSKELILDFLNIPYEFRYQFNVFFTLMMLVNILVGISSVFMSILLGFGKSKNVSIMGITGTLINLLTTYFCASFLSLGIFSLFFAAVLGSFCILFLIFIMEKPCLIPYDINAFKFRHILLRESLTNYLSDLKNKVLPVMGSFFLLFLYMFSLNYLMSFYGYMHVAGLGVGLRIHSIIILPSIALGTAIAINFNKLISEQQYGKLKILFNTGIWLSIIYYFFITTAVIYFGSNIITIFSSNHKIIDSALSYVEFVGPSFFMLGIVLTLMTAFEQTGKGLQMFYLNIIMYSAVITITALLTIYIKNSYQIIYIGIAIGNWLCGIYVIFEVIRINVQR